MLEVVIRLTLLIIGVLVGEYITTKVPDGKTNIEKYFYCLLKISIIVIITLLTVNLYG